MGPILGAKAIDKVGSKVWGGKSTSPSMSDDDKDRIRRMKEIDNTDRIRGSRIRERRTALDYDSNKAG